MKARLERYKRRSREIGKKGRDAVNIIVIDGNAQLFCTELTSEMYMLNKMCRPNISMFTDEG
jgi:hypothetical protein